MSPQPPLHTDRVTLVGPFISEASSLRVGGARQIQLTLAADLVDEGATLRIPLAVDYCLPQTTLARFREPWRAFTLHVECADADPPFALALHDPTQPPDDYVPNRRDGDPWGDPARGVTGRLCFTLAITLRQAPTRSEWHLHTSLDEHLSDVLTLAWPAPLDDRDDEPLRDTLHDGWVRP